MIDPTLAVYVGATLAFAATPGQSTAVVIQQTVDNGWRAGLATAVGVALANVGHATMAGVGLAVLMARMPQALAVIRVAGSLYLAWLGGRSLWRAARPPERGFPAGPAAGPAAFGQGLVTNLLNPSIVTFYLVVVPTFIAPGDRTSRFVLLAAIHVTCAFACHNGWAGLFNQIGHLLRTVRARRVFDVCAGLALIGLAVRMV
ncbi:MAG TPA: LysE family translocator [Vicinamibacterales bacterium]